MEVLQEGLDAVRNGQSAVIDVHLPKL